MLEDERILLVLIPTKGGGVSLRTGYSAGYTSQLNIIAQAARSLKPATAQLLELFAMCRQHVGDL